MKILIISAGLQPKHAGGLPAYVGEMIDGLVHRGHQVVYVDPFNDSPGFRTKFEKTGANPTHYQIFNSGMIESFGKGTRDPLRQVRPGRGTRKALLEIVRHEKPNVVHVHEMIGLPAALIVTIRGLGIPVLFTAQDYYCLCPTIKLFHVGNTLCNLPAEQLDCDSCCRGARPYWTQRTRQLIPFLDRRPRARLALDQLIERTMAGKSRRQNYVHRRYAMIDALNSCDRVICMSDLVEEIYRRAGVDRQRLSVMRLPRRTFRTTKPHVRHRRGGSLVIIASNIYSVEKGISLVEREFALLRQKGVPVNLRIYGEADPKIDNPLVTFHGAYRGNDLDTVIGDADFGLVPSVWWEAYGYIGPEMLTRGLPILATNVGAMREYVRHGENGLLFGPEQGLLASTVERLASDVDLCNQLWTNAAESYKIFQPFDDHITEVEALYVQLAKTVVGTKLDLIGESEIIPPVGRSIRTDNGTAANAPPAPGR